MSTPTPTQTELNDLKLACKKLWELDDNRLRPGEHYDVDVQAGKAFGSAADTATSKLFNKVSKSIWEKPTYVIFYHLLDNYASETGVAETVSMEERKEINDFLDALLKTRPMQYCHKYLVAKGLAEASPAAFKSQLYQMWFAFYRRDGQNDSCGFEHVFVGESQGDDVSGFHNWIQFWIEEVRGNVNYKGYIRPRGQRDTTDDEDHVLSINFEWKGETKPVTTLFIGTSPEFEMALYTLCFLAGEERNFVEIEQYDLVVRCYRIRSKYGDKVGSCFPELVGEDPSNEMSKLQV